MSLLFVDSGLVMMLQMKTWWATLNLPRPLGASGVHGATRQGACLVVCTGCTCHLPTRLVRWLSVVCFSPNHPNHCTEPTRPMQTECDNTLELGPADSPSLLACCYHTSVRPGSHQDKRYKTIEGTELGIYLRPGILQQIQTMPARYRLDILVNLCLLIK